MMKYVLHAKSFPLKLTSKQVILSIPWQLGMLRICSLAGETLVALTAEEFEGQQVKSLKTLVAKQIGVPRFRQRWLSEDHTELGEDAFVIPSDVQLVVLDFVEAEDGDAAKLRYACERNLLEEVEELLRKPMNPNMIDVSFHGDRRTALHSAAENGHEEVVSLLLESGADKDAADLSGYTALHFAAGALHPRTDRTPLAPLGDKEMVRLLLAAGVDKDVAGSGGMTALHWAAANGDNEIVQLLLESGADKDVATSNGRKSALHVAAFKGDLEVVRLLLEAGADKDATDSEGNRAWNLAAEGGHLEVVQLLEAES